MNWEKTSALCPSARTSRSCGRRRSSLALGSPARSGSSRPGWQAAWRRRSSASSTWIFDCARAPARRCGCRAARAVVVAQLVVEPALLGRQLAVDRLLGLRGQLGGDLLLGAAQDEGPQGAGEERAGLRRPGCAARPSVRPKSGEAPEQAGVEELEQAPQLAQVVLDRRAGERQAVAAAQQPGGLAPSGCSRS